VQYPSLRSGPNNGEQKNNYVVSCIAVLSLSKDHRPLQFTQNTDRSEEVEGHSSGFCSLLGICEVSYKVVLDGDTNAVMRGETHLGNL
jgi:hypothetical protein